jgi:hypothetical protein
MREEIESRDTHHRSSGRHFHWPETERTRAVWTDWEWRAWGVGHRARVAMRRAWQSLVTRGHTRDVADDDGDPTMQMKPRSVDEPHRPKR